MRLQHVLARVYGEPWSITPAGWYAIHHVVMAHLDKWPEETARPESKEREGAFGPLRDQMRIDRSRSGDVAVIPVKGSFVKGASLFAKSCGAVSHEDVHADLNDAMGQGIKSVVLDVHSPGGTHVGTPELASKVAELRARGTKVVAWTDHLMGSAAYYVAAGANEVLASPSSIVGSIGTMWEFPNVAKQLEARGVSYNIFTSGPFKGMGHPAKELSEAQANWIQSHVDMLAEQFKSHVRGYRAQVSEDAMQGQIFTGEQALGAGLVDGLVSTLEDAIEVARSR